jgi:biotin-(acetyl-CoA carboxylase) ligase
MRSESCVETYVGRVHTYRTFATLAPMTDAQIGQQVRVHLSDAPEFVATITAIGTDGYLKIEWANGRWAWISPRRIVGAA